MKPILENLTSFLADLPETKQWEALAILRDVLGGEDSARNRARGILERHYREDVDGVADDVLGQLRDELEAENITTASDMQDFITERLSEVVDSTQRVIYTAQALEVPLVSDNADAWQEAGFEHPTPEQVAFCALEADAREEVGRRLDFDELEAALTSEEAGPDAQEWSAQERQEWRKRVLAPFFDRTEN